jgi:hypothetical protein
MTHSSRATARALACTATTAFIHAPNDMPGFVDLVGTGGKRKAADDDAPDAKRRAADPSAGGSWDSYWMVQWCARPHAAVRRDG